jgi:hypothetical protein
VDFAVEDKADGSERELQSMAEKGVAGGMRMNAVVVVVTLPMTHTCNSMRFGMRFGSSHFALVCKTRLRNLSTSLAAHTTRVTGHKMALLSAASARAAARFACLVC